MHRELGDRSRQASVLEALASVACAGDEPDRATWLLHPARRSAPRYRRSRGAALAKTASLAGYTFVDQRTQFGDLAAAVQEGSR